MEVAKAQQFTAVDPDAEGNINNGHGQRTKSRKILVIAMVLIIITLAITGTISSVVIVYNENYKAKYDPPSYFQTDDVLNSVEFQIPLRPHEAWTYRNIMLDKWIEAMNQNSDYLFLSKQNGTEDIYFEYHIQYHGDKYCGISQDYKIRSRTYHNEKITTIDIKGGEEEHSKIDSCTLPIWPSEQYYNESRKKCEEDVHPCFSKFSSATSITFPGIEKPINTCQDLNDLFPGVFFRVKDVNQENEVKFNSPEHWYRMKWTGMVGDRTYYEVQFTIQYEASFGEIMADELSIVAGEWSLRYWCENGTKWELDVVHDFESLFYQLVLLFDKDDAEHIECAHEFFLGEYEGINFDQHKDML